VYFNSFSFDKRIPAKRLLEQQEQLCAIPDRIGLQGGCQIVKYLYSPHRINNPNIEELFLGLNWDYAVY
jgi:hypothetical protein